MADEKKRLDSNVAGNFFVDATCINCDTCRQLAPTSFEEVGNFSAVTQQPTDDGHLQQAYQALLACPVGSIGTEHSDKLRMKEAMASFPLQLEDEVSYCGFNSEKSFGANSFFIEHPDGNWLVDSPRYLKHLVEAFEQKGGIAYIFLTHKDDVADAEKYAAHFGAKRIIHRADVEAAPDAEWIIEGADEYTSHAAVSDHSCAGPHGRQHGPSLQEPVPLHGGSSLVGLRAEDARRSEPAGLEEACIGELHPETPRLPLRMGVGRAWGTDTLAG